MINLRSRYVHFLLGASLCCSAVTLEAQQGRFYLIKDRDTLSVAGSGIRVQIEVDNRLIPFVHDGLLIYPSLADRDSINAIVIEYQERKFRFFDWEYLKKNSSLPVQVIRNMIPKYGGLFEDRRNMYFTIDAYPFETPEREENAKGNATNEKVPFGELSIAELYYQSTEIQTFKGQLRK